MQYVSSHLSAILLVIVIITLQAKARLPGSLFMHLIEGVNLGTYQMGLKKW